MVEPNSCTDVNCLWVFDHYWQPVKVVLVLGYIDGVYRDGDDVLQVDVFGS